jgi:SAM-dependent methyltransferase
MKYSNLAFYDHIATQYDSHLTAADHRARLQVEKIFCQFVAGPCIMDFGGGTGLDLAWTSKKYEKVVFVEPSAKMREQAVQKGAAYHNVEFVQDTCDFSRWMPTHLPCTDKVDGILANFAVFNCISDLAQLFDKIALVARQRSYLIATMIDPKPSRIASHYTLLAMVRLMITSRIVISSGFMDGHRETYIHALHTLRRSCYPHFVLRERIPLNEVNFCVLLFEKL